MRLAAEFIRLPYRFDVEQLQKEVLAIDPSDWITHPSGFAGNSSLPLISVQGEMNDAFHGAMKPTEFLVKSPYLQQVLASFGEVFGRSRLMLLASSQEVPPHVDTNYHWHNRVRIHIPITTNPAVIFCCRDQQVWMRAGETWIFDAWQNHSVHNQSDEDRIHLVIDTAGSAKFWDLVNASEQNPQIGESQQGQHKEIYVPYVEGKKTTILTERYNSPLVMTPGEVDYLVSDIINDLVANQENDPMPMERFVRIANQFRQNWRVVWSLHADTQEGWSKYDALIGRASKPIKSMRAKLTLKSNDASVYQVFRDRILGSVLNPNLASHYRSATPDPQALSGLAEADVNVPQAQKDQ
ncbi:MAG: zinc chelation protein SecC [Planctomycetaceae bacterium]|jgi:hypothetical protein|nr:zinc chelation protein SecC [Planctomycetaceae bacterium]MBP60720.1 zinc chelation protein SecC [Planctomycetaceae bacterium]